MKMNKALKSVAAVLGLIAVVGLGIAAYNALTLTWVANIAALESLGTGSAQIGSAEVLGSQGGLFNWSASCPGTVDGGLYFAANGVSSGCWVRQLSAGASVSPEMWGAAGTGLSSTDDTSAVQACINALMPNSKRTECHGANAYTVSSTVTIPGVVYGSQVYLGQVVPKGYTLPGSWHNAPALFTVSGGQAGFTLHVNTIIAGVSGTGGSANYSVDVLHITGSGAGLSTFEFDTVEQANIVVKISSITNPSSSNLFIGQSWYSNNLGAWVQGNGAPAEGEIFNVNFIDSNNYGGLYFTDGSHFNNVQSQLDFNGVNDTQVEVSSYSGCTTGATFTDTTNSATGEVLALYNSVPLASNVILVRETTSTTGGHSNFTNGNSITCGSLSTTIAGLATTNQGSNAQYDDIIQNYQSDSFAKTVINAPYLGGIVGSLLCTDIITGGNGATAYNNFAPLCFGITNDNSGGMNFYNNATSNGTPFMQLTSTLLSISRAIVGNSFYTFNAGPSMPNNTSTGVTTLATPGTLGADWEIGAYGVNNPNIYAACHAYLPASSTNGDLVCPTALSALLTLSMTSLGVITATQTSGTTQQVIFTFTRRSQ